MNRFSGMTDGEINKLVAEAIFNVVEGGVGGSVCAGDTGAGDMCDYNYCNNWADMGPLLVEKKISLSVFADGSCDAHVKAGGFICYQSEGENPLRAAAEVYLMIKDGE